MTQKALPYTPWLRWLPTLFYAGLIFVASSTPQPIPIIPIPYADKGIHFLEFAILSLLLCWAMEPSGRPLKRNVFLAIIISSLYGASDEYHQTFTPTRTAEVTDWLADSIGAIVMAVLWYRWKGPE